MGHRSQQPRIRAAWRLIAIPLLAVLLSHCSNGNDSQQPPVSVAFRFGIREYKDGSQDFIAVTSNASVISLARSELALSDSMRTLQITGPIERGDGGHNLAWSWHFVPDGWMLAGSTAEVCDGIPQGVEDDLDYWVDVVKAFCPWSSYVKEELGSPTGD